MGLDNVHVLLTVKAAASFSAVVVVNPSPSTVCSDVGWNTCAFKISYIKRKFHVIKLTEEWEEEAWLSSVSIMLQYYSLERPVNKLLNLFLLDTKQFSGYRQFLVFFRGRHPLPISILCNSSSMEAIAVKIELCIVRTFQNISLQVGNMARARRKQAFRISVFFYGIIKPSS